MIKYLPLLLNKMQCYNVKLKKIIAIVVKKLSLHYTDDKLSFQRTNKSLFNKKNKFRRILSKSIFLTGKTKIM